jgi:hypothetical protein
VKKRRAIALALAFAAFVFLLYGFEFGQWGTRIPIVALPIYWLMTQSPWAYEIGAIAISGLIAWFVWRWVMGWFAAMDADRARLTLQRALVDKMEKLQRPGAAL